MITCQINNKPCQMPVGTTIIEAAEQLGFYIPRFCYHKKLSIVANCRMCLVEVVGMNKPLPACATSLSENMQVWTRSKKAVAAQQAVMEFLLINHPLDCPICDQGGQCELQDLAMRYGRDHSDFSEYKRAVPNDNLGSLVATEMTRCIHCTRCVRFGAEIAGNRELGATGRGEDMQITTHINQPLTSELSGNIIDLCPVGALTSKPFQFKARAWELRQVASIAPYDCLGSHTYLHVHDEKVVRVVPRENEQLNETWLSDRDWYAYLGLNSTDRLTVPMVKQEGSWHKTDWVTALRYAAGLIKDVIKQEGSHQIGGLISPSATLEELYLFQKLCRQIGTPHIDHRLREVDTRDQDTTPIFPQSQLAIAELENYDRVILIGTNLQREQPLLITRLRKMVAKEGRIFSINCVDYNFSFEVHHKVIVSPSKLLIQIANLAQYCGASVADEQAQNNAAIMQIGEQLMLDGKTAIIVGAVARHHPQAASIRHWVAQLAAAIHGDILTLTEGANSSGAWLAGAIPHRLPGGGALLDKKYRLYCFRNA